MWGLVAEDHFYKNMPEAPSVSDSVSASRLQNGPAAGQDHQQCSYCFCGSLCKTRRKKMLHNCKRTYERSNFSDTKVSEEEGGGGDSCSGANTRPAAHERSHAGAGECALKEAVSSWRAPGLSRLLVRPVDPWGGRHAAAGFLAGPVTSEVTRTGVVHSWKTASHGRDPWWRSLWRILACGKASD